MQNINKKIATLRKNKGITQEQLAEVLSVSAQAVSKWENSITSPEIQLLPIIARFFGITMDELFNYRLEALNYKERFIRFMADNGVLQFGEFKLQSGRFSPYYIDTDKYKSASQITKLGRFYAECISENNVFPDLLYGNTSKKTSLVISTSMVLFEKYGRDIEYYFANTTKQNKFSGKKITIIEDTLTSGHTLSKAISKIKSENSDVEISVVTSVDRKEMSEKCKLSASDNIRHTFGVNVYSIVTLQDIISSIKSGIISKTDYLESLLEYKNKYTLEEEKCHLTN